MGAPGTRASRACFEETKEDLSAPRIGISGVHASCESTMTKKLSILAICLAFGATAAASADDTTKDQDESPTVDAAEQVEWEQVTEEYELFPEPDADQLIIVP